jgi:hypothetical protein
VRWIALLIMIVVFVGMTGGAYLASAAGWGLPGLMDAPVSIRQESVGGSHSRSGFIYFGSPRRHLGGGFHGGK